MRSFSIFTLLLISSVATVANAGLYAEPFVGYLQGTGDYTLKPAYGGTTDKFTNNGLVYGADVGWIFGNGVRVAGDFEMSNTDVKYETAGTSTKFTTTNILLTVGYKFPKDIIAYVGLGSATSVDDQTPKTTLTGTVAKFGGGKELIKGVQVNVDAIAWLWNEQTTEGSPALKVADVYEKFNSVGVQATVRIPIGTGK